MPNQPENHGFNAETQRFAEKRREKALSALRILQYARKLQKFLWMNYRAKRLECGELAPALGRRRPSESASKLDALQTLRAVRLRLCTVASLR